MHRSSHLPYFYIPLKTDSLAFSGTEGSEKVRRAIQSERVGQAKHLDSRNATTYLRVTA